MMIILNRLIDSLRHELQQYGEMLALLEQQRQQVERKGSEEILATIVAINQQSASIQTAREQRQAIRLQLAQRLGQPPDVKFVNLLPHVPASYRPLINALLEENNELLKRIKVRAQQNHMLMHRSLELMQRFIRRLNGSANQPTTTGDGTATELTPLSSAGLFDPLE